MRKMTLFACTLPLFGLVALVALSLVPATSVAAEGIDAKKLFTETHKCNMCHSVEAEGIEAKTTSEKMKGADLSGFETKKQFSEVAAFVRKQADLDGESHKKPFKGTDEELQAIVDWLGSLEAKKQ